MIVWLVTSRDGTASVELNPLEQLLDHIWKPNRGFIEQGLTEIAHGDLLGSDVLPFTWILTEIKEAIFFEWMTRPSVLIVIVFRERTIKGGSLSQVPFEYITIRSLLELKRKAVTHSIFGRFGKALILAKARPLLLFRTCSTL